MLEIFFSSHNSPQEKPEVLMFHGDKAPITTIDSLSIRNRLSLSYLGMCRLSEVQQGTALRFARNWKDCVRNWAELVKQGTVTDRRLTYCYIFLSSVVNDRLPLPAHIWVGFLFVEAFFYWGTFSLITNDNINPKRAAEQNYKSVWYNNWLTVFSFFTEVVDRNLLYSMSLWKEQWGREKMAYSRGSVFLF